MQKKDSAPLTRPARLTLIKYLYTIKKSKGFAFAFEFYKLLVENKGEMLKILNAAYKNGSDRLQFLGKLTNKSFSAYLSLYKDYKYTTEDLLMVSSLDLFLKNHEKTLEQNVKISQTEKKATHENQKKNHGIHEPSLKKFTFVDKNKVTVASNAGNIELKQVTLLNGDVFIQVTSKGGFLEEGDCLLTPATTSAMSQQLKKILENHNNSQIEQLTSPGDNDRKFSLSENSLFKVHKKNLNLVNATEPKNLNSN